VSRTASIDIGGRSIEVSRPDKVMFPDVGITKVDLAAYYAAVAETMLPHLRDRPLTFQRYPDGIGAKGFYQKDVPRHYPDWIERVEVDKEGGSLTHVIVRDEPAALVYLADQACITPHAWLSTTAALDRPDRIVIDLDPSVDDPALVRAAARDVRAIFEAIELVPFLMTTGSRGFHVVSPIHPDHDNIAVRALARDIGELVVRGRPSDYTTEWSKAKRGGRLLLDYFRHGYAQTAVVPYGVRARPGAPVATPIDWQELAGLASDAYTLRSVVRRLAQKDDPWRDIEMARGSMSNARRALDRILESRVG
jgi:bifunctional non-homologous end joining protein LigD